LLGLQIAELIVLAEAVSRHGWPDTPLFLRPQVSSEPDA
jgi:hypothetical protein